MVSVPFVPCNTSHPFRLQAGTLCSLLPSSILADILLYASVCRRLPDSSGVYHGAIFLIHEDFLASHRFDIFFFGVFFPIEFPPLRHLFILLRFFTPLPFVSILPWRFSVLTTFLLESPRSLLSLTRWFPFSPIFWSQPNMSSRWGF